MREPARRTDSVRNREVQEHKFTGHLGSQSASEDGQEVEKTGGGMTEHDITRLYTLVSKSAVYAEDSAKEIRKYVTDGFTRIHDRLDDMGEKINDAQVDIAEIKSKMVTGERASEIIANHVEACDHSPHNYSPAQKTKILIAIVTAIGTVAVALVAAGVF